MKYMVCSLIVLLTAGGCATQDMTESRKFVTAVDSLNVSMKTVNNLYDQGIIADKDYKAASAVFFQAVNYVMQWNESIKAGTDKPDLRFHVVELSRQLAILALGDTTDE